MPFKRKKKEKREGAPDWLLTYGDMTTLLLVFFVVMFTTAEIDGSELRMILAAFQGLGVLRGGNTLQVGKLAELGNNIMALPSMERGRALDKARKLAKSIFEPEIASEKVVVKEDERGLVISLSAELFFAPNSAEVNIEEARDLLIRVARLLNSDELKGRKVRIEGHTDNVPPDTEEWPTNWDLSVARSLNVFKHLLNYGVAENMFQIAGFADTVPAQAPSDMERGIYSEQDIVNANASPDQMANNRRVDIIILTEGHL